VNQPVAADDSSSTAVPASGTEPAAEDATAAADDAAGGAARDTILVTGRDAEAYLQGQVSADVCALAEGATAWSLALEPTGKMVALFRIHRCAGGAFLVDVDAGHAEPLLARLRRFVLRTDVSFEPSAQQIPEPFSWPGVSDPADERQRILALLPRMGAEITPETIPAECGQTMIDLAVSFDKGCYTGQELVARIDSRGARVPRPIRVLQAGSPIAPAATVVFEGAEVGRVTSAAGDVALAQLKRAVRIGSVVQAGGVDAVLIEPVGS